MKLQARITDKEPFRILGSRQWVRMRLNELPPGDYDVEIKKHIKKRSNNQLRYYWAVIVPLVFKGLRDAGFDSVRDEEDAHNVIKEMHFRKVFFSESKGDIAAVVSTSQYSTVEIEERFDIIRQWAWEFLNVMIPLPNEQMSIDFDRR